MGILVQGRCEFCDSAGLINSQEEADSAGPGPHSKEQLESLSGGMVLKMLIKVLGALIPHLTFKTPLGGTPPKDPWKLTLATTHQFSTIRCLSPGLGEINIHISDLESWKCQLDTGETKRRVTSRHPHCSFSMQLGFLSSIQGRQPGLRTKEALYFLALQGQVSTFKGTLRAFYFLPNSRINTPGEGISNWRLEETLNSWRNILTLLPSAHLPLN